MRKLIIIAVVLLAAGAVICGIAFAVNGTDIIYTEKFEENTHAIEEKFTSVSISGGSGDIKILPSADGKCTVVSYDSDRVTHLIAVEDGTLSVVRNYHRINNLSMLGKDDNGVIIYLPRGEYEAVKAGTESGDVNADFGDSRFDKAECFSSSGDVHVENLRSGNLRAEAASGNVVIAGTEADSEIKAVCASGDITADKLTAGIIETETSSGDIVMENVSAESEITAGSVSGDVIIGCGGAGNVSVKTSSGEITVSDIKADGVSATSSSGDVEISDSSVSGDLHVRTSSGDIEIRGTDVGGRNDVKSSSGDVSFTN